MQLQPVNSSQINAIGYAAATKTLQIEFKGGSLYEYANVPPDLFEEFAKAPSIGSFFYKNIKNDPVKYPYVKLEDNKAVEAPAPEPKAGEEASIPTPVETTDLPPNADDNGDPLVANDEPVPTSGEEATTDEHQSDVAAASDGASQNPSNCQ
jgi:hypothetical protein